MSAFQWSDFTHTKELFEYSRQLAAMGHPDKCRERMKKFQELRGTSPAVHSFLCAWESGMLASFEMALIEIIIHLGEDNERLLKLLTEKRMLEPIVF